LKEILSNMTHTVLPIDIFSCVAGQEYVIEKLNPDHYSYRGSVRKPCLIGVKRPKFLDPIKVITNAWNHHLQDGESGVTGLDILGDLISSFDPSKDGPRKKYKAQSSDAIHGHFGLAELKYLKDVWTKKPKALDVLKDWAQGKLLCGWADVSRTSAGFLDLPCLRLDVASMPIDWIYLNTQFTFPEKIALRDIDL
jgi:hypothetical protein